MCDSWPESGSSTTPSWSRRERARTNSSRASFRRSGAASTPASSRGSGSRSPWSARSAGFTKSSQPTSDDTGLPGQPEDERLAAHAERHRLARLDRDAPEHLLDAELRLDPPHEVVRADRHAAGRDEDVGRRVRARVPRGVPTRRRRPAGSTLDVGAGGGERGREHDAVRLVDLARLERLAGMRELAAGREHDDARSARADTVGDAGGRERAELCRAEPDACSERRRRPQPRRRRADERARRRQPRRADSIVLSCWTTYSMGTTASAPAGTTPPVEISIASPAASAAARPDAPPRCCRRRRACPGTSARANGEAVHRRAGERRQVDGGERRLRADASRSVADRHGLGAQTAARARARAPAPARG